MQNKKPLVGATVVVLIILAIFIFNSFNKKKSESVAQVNALSEKMSDSKKEFTELYQKRFELLQEWYKIAGEKPAENMKTYYPGALKTSEDFKNFDFFQVGVTKELSRLLTKDSVKKKIKDLEKIEFRINRVRNEYSASAFEADDLIQKYKTGQDTAPVFPAEKMLHDQKK